MDKIDLKNLPFIVIIYFGLISPYYIAWYLFDKQDFLLIDNITKILLCVGYTFPVLCFVVLNAILQYFILFKDSDFFEQELYVIFTYICYGCAFYLYIMLFIHFYFFSTFTFACFINHTWIWIFIITASSIIFAPIVNWLKKIK